VALPCIVHQLEDEWFYVMEGEYVAQVGDERFTLTAGDSLLAPREVPHTTLKWADGEGKAADCLPTSWRYGSFFSGDEQVDWHAVA